MVGPGHIGHLQTDADVGRLGVFDDICQGLVGNPVKGGYHLHVHLRQRVDGQVNVDALLVQRCCQS